MYLTTLMSYKGHALINGNKWLSRQEEPDIITNVSQKKKKKLSQVRFFFLLLSSEHFSLQTTPQVLPNLTSGAPLRLTTGWSAPLEKATGQKKKKKSSLLWWQTGSHPGRHIRRGGPAEGASPSPGPPPRAVKGGEGVPRRGGCEKPGRHAESRRQGV